MAAMKRSWVVAAAAVPASAFLLSPASAFLLSPGPAKTARLCTVSVLVSRVEAEESDTYWLFHFPRTRTVPRLQIEGARMGVSTHATAG